VRALFNDRWPQRLAVFVVLAAMLAMGCRAIYTVHELQPSSAPDISRLMLKNGNVVVFNADLGWYNNKAGTIEGMTADTQHVEYHLSEINKVETVREYSLIPAVFVAGVVLLAGIYLVARLLLHGEFLY
jgi:hypothetical protein